MTPPRIDLADWTRRARVLAWQWQHQLGVTGVVAVALALAGLLLSLWLVPTLERARDAQLREQTQRITQAARLQSGADESATDLRDDWMGRLPPWSQRSDVVGGLLARARKAGVEVEHAEYRAERLGSGLMRLHVTLSAAASYASVRQHLAAVFNEMPSAGLDALDLERAKDEVGVNGKVHWSLYFREAP